MALTDLILNSPAAWRREPRSKERSVRETHMNTKKQSSFVLILAAWIIVCVPAAWGLYNTAVNALKLFTNSTPATTVSTPVAPSGDRKAK
jgi:hypothetical protein